MQDEDTSLPGLCADLVSLKKYEPFLLHLLSRCQPGEWMDVATVCRQLQLEVGDSKLDLFGVWLPDPRGDSRYAVIVFYDEESIETFPARYNRQRLLKDAQPGNTPYTTEVTPP
jgi:hypothetical protein